MRRSPSAFWVLAVVLLTVTLSASALVRRAAAQGEEAVNAQVGDTVQLFTEILNKLGTDPVVTGSDIVKVSTIRD